jgi:hypothetical protein
VQFVSFAFLADLHSFHDLSSRVMIYCISRRTCLYGDYVVCKDVSAPTSDSIIYWRASTVPGTSMKTGRSDKINFLLLGPIFYSVTHLSFIRVPGTPRMSYIVVLYRRRGIKNLSTTICSERRR